MTTHEAMHRFLCVYVPLEQRDRAEECLRLLLEMAENRAARKEIEAILALPVNDTDRCEAPEGGT